MLTIEVGPSPGTVRPAGEIDIATAPLLRTALTQARDSGEQVVVDMAGVTFIDSSGLHALLSAASSLNGAAPLVLENVGPQVERLLEIVGAHRTSTLEIRTQG